MRKTILKNKRLEVDKVEVKDTIKMYKDYYRALKKEEPTIWEGLEYETTRKVFGNEVKNDNKTVLELSVENGHPIVEELTCGFCGRLFDLNKGFAQLVFSSYIDAESMQEVNICRSCVKKIYDGLKK